MISCGTIMQVIHHCCFFSVFISPSCPLPADGEDSTVSIQIKLENEGSDEELETDMLYSPQLALKLALTEWLGEFCVPHQYNSKRSPISYYISKLIVYRAAIFGFTLTVLAWTASNDNFTTEEHYALRLNSVFQAVRCLRVVPKARPLMCHPWLLLLSALPQQSPLFSSSPSCLQPYHLSVWINSHTPWQKDLKRKKR